MTIDADIRGGEPRVRAVRGATVVAADERELLCDAVCDLLGEMMRGICVRLSSFDLTGRRRPGSDARKACITLASNTLGDPMKINTEGQAAIPGLALLTRDPARYEPYYPTIELISPD